MFLNFIHAGKIVPFQKILGCFFFFLFPLNISFAASALLPEIQAYHSVGTRGSSYSTVAGGLAIQLSIKQIGPNRWLHILGLYSPEQIGINRGKAAGWVFLSHGQGVEIGIYDQKRTIGNFRGANIALRHLEWETTHLGNKVGKVSTDIIHLGWTVGSKLMMLVGADFAMMHTPDGSLIETQLALGSRFAF